MNDLKVVKKDRAYFIAEIAKVIETGQDAKHIADFLENNKKLLSEDEFITAEKWGQMGSNGVRSTFDPCKIKFCMLQYVAPHRIEYPGARYHVRRISRLKKYDRKNTRQYQHGPIVDPLYRNTRGVGYSDETGNIPGKTGSAINPNNNKKFTLKTISQ